MEDQPLEDFKTSDLQTIKSFKLSNDGAFTVNGYIKWRKQGEKKHALDRRRVSYADKC